MTHSADLTATEVSNLWSAYMKSSMEQRLFEYFHSSSDDEDIKRIAGEIVSHAKHALNDLHTLFNQEKLTIPHAFTDQDVTPDAHKIFSDTFILFACHDITMLSMSTYPSAFSDCSRQDITQFFQERIETMTKVQNEITQLMVEKGVYLKPAQLNMESEIDYVSSKKYLLGITDQSRPLNAPEIANLSRILHRAQFSKMVFVTFYKMASTKELKDFFVRGRNELEKVLDSLSEVLEKENIPLAASIL
ncbi:hypothetical protein J2R98_001291 [Alkalibacillus filiformis]|uniref:DUF3231 family protein n=1 Tax=Alkalibacillus filiformis TaxID=200990 RepID=A0ABU0DST7_9BACI|nr:DUF3231 family protein [Alkalibacillus filiformis]MDQ0351477.1 hypothetical protein [Alkalibacillus filiformis]